MAHCHKCLAWACEFEHGWGQSEMCQSSFVPRLAQQICNRDTEIKGRQANTAKQERVTITERCVGFAARIHALLLAADGFYTIRLNCERSANKLCGAPILGIFNANLTVFDDSPMTDDSPIVLADVPMVLLAEPCLAKLRIRRTAH